MRNIVIALALFASAIGAPASVVELLRPEMRDAWTFEAGPEFPGAQGTLWFDDFVRLNLAYDFANGGSYVGAFASLDTLHELSAVRLRLRKPAEAALTLRIMDRTGQSFQKPVQFTHSDWQTVRVRCDEWTSHFGGAGDGVLHQPVQKIGLLVESEGLSDPAGTVLIARVYVELGSRASENTREEGIGTYTYEVTDFRTGFSPSGAASPDNGAWSFDFRDHDSATLQNSLALHGTPRSLTLEVDGGAPGMRVALTLASHFQTFTRTIGTLSGTRDEFTVPAPPDGWDFSGGHDDGVVRPPLRLTKVLFERGDGPVEHAHIERVRLQCTTSLPRAQRIVVESKLIAQETAGEREYLLIVRGRRLAEELGAIDLNMEIFDWQARRLHQDARHLSFTEDDDTVHTTLTFSLPAALPFVEAVVVARAPGQCDVTSRATFTAMPAGSADTTLRPESPWGMGVYLYRYPNSPDGLRLMDEAAALASRAGVKWSREEFNWAAMEHRPGDIDFEFYDAVVDTASRHGISVYGLLAYWARWTEPYTERGIDDFCRWTRAVVNRYKDRITHWEVYNEPNIFFWSGPKELYPVLLERCYRAIKEEDPEATVLGISTAGIDTAFIEQCLDAGAPLDGVTIHPYRTSFSETRFMEDLREVKALVGGRPVWITEMGWSTQVGGVSERAQAVLLARTYLTAVLSGACGNVSWYNFRNDGPDPYYNEHQFGVLYSDLQPKPAYRALTTLCTTLNEGLPTPRTDFGSPIHALQVGANIALWSPVDCNVAWRVTQESPLVLNLMGEAINPRIADAISYVALRDGAPIFVRGGVIEGVVDELEAKVESILEF